MKLYRIVPVVGAICSLFLSAHAATVTLPASAAAPLGSSTTRGMIVRSVQAPIDAEVSNSSLRATRQLNGTLTDAGGILITNEALPGPNADGSYFVDEASFEKDG